MADQHIGFHNQAPQEVIWSDSAWLRPVDPGEESRIRILYKCIMISSLTMIILSGGLFFLRKTITKIYPDLESMPWLHIVNGLFVAGMLLFFSHGPVLKRIIFRQVRRRSGRLFEPDKDTLFVGMEDAFTYDKPKLAPDDLGVLKITPDLILFEMTNHRAQFYPWDLEVSVLHTGKTHANLRLTCNQSPVTWSVTLSPIAPPGRLINAMGQVKKANQFRVLFEQAGVNVPGVSEPTDELPMAYPVTPPPIPTGLQLDSEEDIEDRPPVPPIDEMDSQAVPKGPPPIPLRARPVPPPEEVEHPDLLQSRYENVREAILKKQKKKKNAWINLLIVLVSLVLFYHLGKKYWGIEFILVLLPALILHEAGHYVGMKIFGYKNMQVFFIPMLGAAVSGHGRDVATWKKAVVTLLGPLPGILLSLPLFIVYLVTGWKVCFLFGLILLILNLLNLLPFFPLDGGRFMHEVLYSRNRYFEMAMSILAAGVFLLLGAVFTDWIFLVLGLLNLTVIRYKFKLASASTQLQQELAAGGVGGVLNRMEGEEIPEGILKHMIHWVYENMPGPIKPQTAATMITEIWDRVRIRPPGVGATVALIAVFCLGYLISFVSIGVLAVGSFLNESEYKTEIVQGTDDDGRVYYKEQCLINGRVDSEVCLSDDQQYYHGEYLSYYDDMTVYEKGQWNMGRKVGTWTCYEPNGAPTEEIVYEQGRPILIRWKWEGSWEEEKWEDFSEEDKEMYRRRAEFQQGPDRSLACDYAALCPVAEEDPNQKESALK